MQPTIEVISDVVCPWCFIGKRRLERALELIGAHGPAPAVTWRPFQLNPQLPPAGVDRNEYVETKFGGAARARQIYERVANAGAEVGIPFAFERIQRQPNTVNAHRMIEFAERHGRQDVVVEALFKAFFLEGVDIGDITQLTMLAERVGLEGEVTRAYLESDEDVDAVKAADEWARNAGVSGVPFFVFNKKYAVSGAQEPTALVEAYRQAVNAQKQEGVA